MMVTIVTRGTIPERPAPLPDWWQRCDHRCHNCDTVYRLDESDRPALIHLDHGNDRLVLSSCPVCGYRVETRQSLVNILRGSQQEVARSMLAALRRHGASRGT